MKKVSESLAGRWDDLVLNDVTPAANWTELVRRGGYPTPAYEYTSDEARQEWFVNYTRTYWQRDIPDLADIENLPDFRRLMHAVTLYQLIRLPAYAVSRTKRLIKSPKLYWADTALAMSIAGEYEPREAHLENPVVNDLLAWHDTTARPSEVMYWRTMAGQEVDIVIETPQGQLIPIEVKATSRPSTKMIAPLRTFMDEYEDLVLGGLLLHAGEETFWISPKVLAVSWWRVS